MRREPVHRPEGREAGAKAPPRRARKARTESYDPELVEQVEALRRDPIAIETTSVDEFMAWLRRPGR